jgi:hypothetical protein
MIYFNVHNGVYSTKDYSLCAACYFLLAQKVTKKGTCANAPARKAHANLAGARGLRTYTADHE